MDKNGHGTHVAGTIAALRNEIGVVGAAPEAHLYALKVFGDSGSASYDDIIAAIQWAAEKGIKITNNSYGSKGNPGTLVEQAFTDTYDKGMLHVAAAGYEGNPRGIGDIIIYPARFSSVIEVAASTSYDSRASFSSTGPAVELIAPGASINSTILGGVYGVKSGTSMASPQVAGVAALVWAADSSLNNTQVRGILQQTAQNLGLNANHQGNGLVRADLAVAEVVETGQTLKYTLTLETSPPEGGTAIDNTNTGPYVVGAEVSVTATANTDYAFFNWTVGAEVVSENATFDYTMPAADTILTANFSKLPEEPIKYALTLAANPSNGGTATDDTGEGSYEAGTVVSVTATANAGYEFVNWKVDADVVSEDSTFDYIMPAANTTLTANFNELAGPPIEGTVTVQPIVYSGSGGRDNNKHLHVTISLIDDLGSGVSGASVSITLERNGSLYATATGSTNSIGSVTFSFNNAPSGTYRTLIDDVSATGLTWDGAQPDDPTVTR